MGLKYTEEKLNSLDKETIIQLFLSQQEQLESINQNLRLVLEQMADLKRHRFGRSTERHETEGQISFMEVDGTVVFLSLIHISFKGYTKNQLAFSVVCQKIFSIRIIQ